MPLSRRPPQGSHAGRPARAGYAASPLPRPFRSGARTGLQGEDGSRRSCNMEQQATGTRDVARRAPLGLDAGRTFRDVIIDLNGRLKTEIDDGRGWLRLEPLFA